MNFFLSKPIRRPALKHVLKTYCPPIPEEEGEVTTPPPMEPSSSKSNGRATASRPSTAIGVNNATVPVTIIATPSDNPDGEISPLS
ncbi:hypothetical protein CC78DRAFT_17735 [Lojkania enalia]|uniref:Uncharacterized protein n=1 Tax=Lojkania enalia TaxID=147567 RepID=A0A9P4N706_9PLEO|nr:hypothetical protein CC78DRAFT_17735 [Didymosphaeria enalia]